jgi:gluconate kinase
MLFIVEYIEGRTLHFAYVWTVNHDAIKVYIPSPVEDNDRQSWEESCSDA